MIIFYSHQNQEVSELVSLFTTHHTFFFREFVHFEFMLNNLDSIVQSVKSRGDKEIRIFSAACSRGQEAYSLAMFFHEHLLKNYPEMDFEIIASDIDPKSVEFAQNGVYPIHEVKTIPSLYLKQNWQKGVGELAHFGKVKDHLKQKIKYSVVNLFELEREKSLGEFDLIFCRNVFIYFKSPDIVSVTNQLKNLLYFNGYLVTGISESLLGVVDSVISQAPSVYQFKELVKKLKVSEGDVHHSHPLEKFSSKRNPIRVLLVDDSKIIIKLLNSLFAKDDDFEVIGTAANGLEAQKFLAENEVDAMTLDIHMPEMNGVELLQSMQGKKIPRTIMVSSASREDKKYSQVALSYGAMDFVEKPTMQNLEDVGDEIKSKLKMAFMVEHEETRKENVIMQMAHNFNLSQLKNKCRIIFAKKENIYSVISFVKSLDKGQPPLYIYLADGNDNDYGKLHHSIQERTSFKCEELSSPNSRDVNVVYLVRMEKLHEIANFHIKTSVCFFDQMPTQILSFVKKFKNVQILINEYGNNSPDLIELASDVFPWTSFEHISTEFLSDEDDQ